MLVASAGIRPFVRGIVERFRAEILVISRAEIHPRVRLKTVGSIWNRRLHGLSQRFNDP